MRLLKWLHGAVALVLMAAAACHPHAGVEQGPAASNVITFDEIAAANASNVYDLIVRIRPEYLRDRGAVSILTKKRARATVFLNDQEYGELETMRNFPVDRIGEVHYFSGSDAVARFGSQYGGGVIQLISRVQ